MLEKIMKYKYIIILILLIMFPAISKISWLNDDQNRIVNEFIKQSNSQIAIRTRNDDFGEFRFSPIYIPILTNNIHEKDRAELLTSTFQKELLTDAVFSDLPSEYGITRYFKDELIKYFIPLRAHSNNDKFGTIKCKINDDSILVLNRNPKEPSLIFVISSDTDILEIEYENLEYNNIKLVGKKEGVAQIEIMLITKGGTDFEKRKVKITK